MTEFSCCPVCDCQLENIPNSKTFICRTKDTSTWQMLPYQHYFITGKMARESWARIYYKNYNILYRHVDRDFVVEPYSIQIQKSDETLGFNLQGSDQFPLLLSDEQVENFLILK